MKFKNDDLPVKIFLVVVAVVLVGLIVAWSTGVFKDKKKDLNEGTERINKAISSMTEFDLLTYDGGSVTGSFLLDLIEDVRKGKLDLEISVITGANGSQNFSPSVTPTPVADRHNDAYINPNGIFVGKLERDENGIIEKITFTQQK